MKSKKLGRFEAVTLVYTLWNIAKTFDILGDPTLKKAMLEKFKPYGIKERELNDKFALNLVFVQHALVETAKEELIKDLQDIMELSKESMNKFYSHFDVNANLEAEVLDFLTSKERMKQGILSFARKFAVDPYFYHSVLPFFFNKNILGIILSSSRINIKVADIKEAFKELMREGKLIEKNGEIWVSV